MLKTKGGQLNGFIRGNSKNSGCDKPKVFPIPTEVISDGNILSMNLEKLIKIRLDNN
ncbi:hypothetical protein [Oceanobacillus senegalensis]|uniref:hypothetical protein n=1 Tax=Oceanobacillus senegalensis TaxID=1936063 RepID=UPI001C4F9127|nr:hypothetical protein [Oceanobacillus senegalensis]